MDVPPLDEPVEADQGRLRASAFRRWIAGGAEPGGLRALAGRHDGATADDGIARARKFARGHAGEQPPGADGRPRR
jgi:hypothetical protein